MSSNYHSFFNLSKKSKSKNKLKSSLNSNKINQEDESITNANTNTNENLISLNNNTTTTKKPNQTKMKFNLNSNFNSEKNVFEVQGGIPNLKKTKSNFTSSIKNQKKDENVNKLKENEMSINISHTKNSSNQIQKHHSHVDSATNSSMMKSQSGFIKEKKNISIHPLIENLSSLSKNNVSQIIKSLSKKGLEKVGNAEIEFLKNLKKEKSMFKK